MNTKRLTLLTMLLLVLALVACGGDSGDSAALQAEVDSLTQQLADANAALEEAAAAPADAPAAAPEMVTFAGAGDTLQTIQDRGVLKCGGNANVPGFGYLEPDTSEFTGFDIDFCHAIAAAALGDAEAIEVTPLSGTARFPTLQSGEIDILIRNTTWTFTRDTALGFDFTPVTFYDGQGMMVRKDAGIDTMADLAGGTICVQAGTTTEKNLSDYFSANGIDYTPLVFPDAPTTLDAYDQGSCDGFTTDKSGLVSNQILLSDPSAHKILVEDMSREPLGPLTRHGDNNWNDVASWAVLCTINAEFLDITSENVDSMLGGDDPTVTDLLGETGDLGQNLGLSNDFCYQIIKQVGNYEEIYNRNLGPDTPFDLPRGLNALYTDGGILYPIPFK